ncbi:sterol carrier protein domain-containing protein [Peribacillus sp. SCS-37]|uniref:sterol carrier protein domain-containing protein n=1 Tax=Paraperibacillus esterisolvens TaxID=3115296 RepID=UPI0039058D76
MARIVDAERFLKLFSFNRIEKPVILHIKDSIAEWNNQSFVLKEEGVFLLYEAGEGLTLTISSLTALLLGAQGAETLWDIGEISGTYEDMQKLKEAVPVIRPLFLDFF